MSGSLLRKVTKFEDKNMCTYFLHSKDRINVLEVLVNLLQNRYVQIIENISNILHGYIYQEILLYV